MTTVAPLSVLLVGLLGALVFLVAVGRIAVAERRLIAAKAVAALDAVTPSEPVVDAGPGIAAA